jgi:1-acyl-sn-glycerol-3-phosphate acyltransferase
MSPPPEPTVGPSVPRDGNAFTRAVGRAALRLIGWRIEGEVPDVPKLVAIVAPHTSNLDFFVAYAAKMALRLRFQVLVKHSLFRPPLGWLMRWAGGVPIDRGAADRVVETAVSTFARQPRFLLALAPEGTRRRVDRWKTGFWRIAHAARVPIWTVALDWQRRVVQVGPAFWTTGDMEGDLAALQSRYTPRMARHPESYGVAAPAPRDRPARGRPEDGSGAGAG